GGVVRGERGQIDVKGRSLADVAGNPEEAAVAAHDAEDGGEAEAGALADALGGEERLEDLVEVFGGDADAGVADGQAHVVAGFDFSGEARVGLGDFKDAGLKREGAAGGHGVAGVDGEVEQDLVELGRV